MKCLCRVLGTGMWRIDIEALDYDGWVVALIVYSMVSWWCHE